MMATSNGLKNLQCSATKCWGQGRQCGSKSNTLCDEEPAYRTKQDTHREGEREIGTKNNLYSRRQQLQMTTTATTTFSKAYKVTLYSDSLRATALYAIYTNGPNLGCPRGQCEYVHYTLVFDIMNNIN